MVITTATQICFGVTGTAASIRQIGPSPVGIVLGISGSTTPTIARNLQAVTTSSVSSRSENLRMRPFECSTSRIETASSGFARVPYSRYSSSRHECTSLPSW